MCRKLYRSSAVTVDRRDVNRRPQASTSRHEHSERQEASQHRRTLGAQAHFSDGAAASSGESSMILLEIAQVRCLWYGTLLPGHSNHLLVCRSVTNTSTSRSRRPAPHGSTRSQQQQSRSTTSSAVCTGNLHYHCSMPCQPVVAIMHEPWAWQVWEHRTGFGSI